MLRQWPDVEPAVGDLLAPLVPAGHVNDNTPNGLEQVLPFLRVGGFAGGDDGWTWHPVIDVDVFAATRTACHDLAEQARTRLLDYPHLVGQVLIDEVETVQAPSRTPWDNPDVHRYTATYRLSVRAFPAAS